ncbi:MAG: TadE/TadG family type IV pilus assembly protein [Acidimicrobiia bacterium]
MGRRAQAGETKCPGSRGERGAALIEAALISVLLIALLLGIVTAGIAYGRFNALQAAAREASRFGATLPVPGGGVDTWLSQVRDVAKAAAIGELAASIPGQYVCVALLGPPGTPRRLEETAGSSAYDNSECFSDGRPAGESRTQVMVRRDTELLVAYFSADITLRGQAAARFER